MRRNIFLFLSILSAFGVHMLGKAANCAGKRGGRGEIGIPEFPEDSANLVFSTECQYHVLQCRSVNYCSIQWLFNGVPYDSWHLGQNSGTDYLLEDGNQTLKFTSADVDAQGVYTCVVSNGVTSINRTIDLVVEEELWLHKPIPYGSTSGVCKNQTAVLGGNATFFCQFKYRRAGIFLQHSWRKLNETYGDYELVSFYEIQDTQFTVGSETEEESFAQSKICPEQEAPKILSTWLNITNVTEEALGKYQVTCQIAQYLTLVNLTLSLEVTDKSVRRVTNTTSVVVVVATMTVLLALILLSWKRYGVDAKLWYHNQYGKLETEENDGKIYDAYIVSCYEGVDRSFVDNILYPSLQDQYKLYLRHRDATFGSVESQEIAETLSKSRRCIVILSADFYRCLPTSSAAQQIPSSSISSSEWHLYELQQALDMMHRHVIPLLYRDSGPNLSSTADSSAKLIDHVIKDLKCVSWKQKSATRLDDWAMKRLRLRLPSRRRNDEFPAELTSVSLPFRSSDDVPPLSNPSPLPSETSDLTKPSHVSKISLKQSPMQAPLPLSSSYRSAPMSIPSADSRGSSLSPTSPFNSSLTLSPSRSSINMSPNHNSSPAISPSQLSTDSGVALESYKLDSFQGYEPNSNRVKTPSSISKFFSGRKNEPYLLDNENM